jgi:hypothetical protein
MQWAKRSEAGEKESRLFAVFGETAHKGHADPGCRDNGKP